MPRYAKKQEGKENILFLSSQCGNSPENNPQFCRFFQADTEEQKDTLKFKMCTALLLQIS